MRHILIFVVALLPGLALAKDCRFVTECYEADGCYETEYDLSIDMGGGTATIETIVGTFSAPAQTVDGLLNITGFDLGMFHMITIADGGTARYAVHSGDASGVTMITYHGTCG